MKILLIVTGLGMGGAERQVCDLADNFYDLGHDVMLISMTGEIVNRPKAESIKVIDLAMTKSPYSLFKAYLDTHKIISLFKPDVVHSHMIHANIFSRLLRIFTMLPRLICTAHSTNEGGSFRMLAYRLTDRLCDLTTNVSQEAVERFVERGAVRPARIMTVCNGIDTNHFRFNKLARDKLRHSLGISDESSLFLSVGRLTKAKDYPNLLKAFSTLTNSYSDSNLVIIGVGEQENDLKTLSKKLNIAKRVHFLGLRRDICDWMSAADLYVMSSAWEGMPLVLLEAMACERVIVATDCGGVKEVVGDAGFLVPPMDSDELAAALVNALELSLAKRQELGFLARKRIEKNYSLNSVCMHWLKIYKVDYTPF